MRMLVKVLVVLTCGIVLRADTFLLCQNLTDEQLDREFAIGHRTVRATLLHIIWNMEVWTDLMSGLAVRTSQAGPFSR